MKLDYSYREIAKLLSNTTSEDETLIRAVAFDSRRISVGEGILFFALDGVHRDGHDFISSAYEKGVRHFVVSKTGTTRKLEGASEIVVSNTLRALQTLAAHHRSRFSCSVVAITGSNGKTIVKEWLSQLLSGHFAVVRSPKSYNSKLGSALSLLEINATTQVAIIEVGVPEQNEMIQIAEMVQPTHGIFTSFGTAHRDFFESEEAHLKEKLVLFDQLDHFIYPETVDVLQPSKGIPISTGAFASLLAQTKIADPISRQNAQLAIAMALELGMTETQLSKKTHAFDSLAMRLESYEGIHNNTIINDTYSLDAESLRLSLAYQLANSNGKKRIVVIGLGALDPQLKETYRAIVEEFQPDALHFYSKQGPSTFDFSNSSVLFKGTRDSGLEKIARAFKLHNHQTYLEIDLKAIRDNIARYRQSMSEDVQILCMVKASSYGSGARKMGLFLQELGVNYLGVAYTDEGAELRASGVNLPILVMNCEPRTFAQCIDQRLEPAIFSLQQLNEFISELMARSITRYPIHLKLETGMHRLGFEEEVLADVIELIKAQPEVEIKSVYSHLATAEDPHSELAHRQIEKFERLSSQIRDAFSQPILRHLLNSNGIHNFPQAHYEMVRLGIGMYGVQARPGFRSALSWMSTVSQVKTVEAGESVGYSHGFIATSTARIAVIPVGYADGFRRSLGKGRGGVYIQNRYCPVVGNVCMDMIMVDIGNLDIHEGEKVEIIGKHQSIQAFAEKLETIPYEVMTGISSRVHRIFIDQ